MGDMPDLDRLKDRAQDVRKDVNALALESIEALRKAVDELTTTAKANASGAGDLGAAKLEDLSEAIRRKPLSYFVAGIGLGLVLGLWRQRDIR